jgi:hypothetical protein
MKRRMDNILGFNKEAGLDRVKNLSLYERSRKHIIRLENELSKNRSSFWQPYNIEAFAKYLCKILLDLSSDDKIVFKKFYRDNKRH